MSVEELKSRLLKANKAYREGSPFMTDQEFDDLCDELQSMVDPADWAKFRDGLNEGRGKVRHPYVMGSLDKLKAEEPDTVFDFVKRHVRTGMAISAKVDGISCRLHYSKGQLLQASTRGDGEYGEDLTGKIRHVQKVPAGIDDAEDLDIRGELVILKDDFARMSGYKNPRNACAGIMNRKDWKREDVEKVTFVAYTILGPKYGKVEQFMLLRRLGFKTAWGETVQTSLTSRLDARKLTDLLVEAAKRPHTYETDGLVISDAKYRNEDKYRPDAQVAFKLNELEAWSKLVDVSWEGPSKNGRLAPVGIIEPVEIGGATISRVTLNNLDFIAANRLAYGSDVKIVKSGDIIPKVVEVKNGPNVKPVDLPEFCPSCGAKLVKAGPHLTCPNEDCGEKLVMRLTDFVRKLDVQNVSDATIRSWGLKTVKDLLGFRPAVSSKSQVKFYEELKAKVFKATKRQLLSAMYFQDIGTTILDKMFDQYGFDNVLEQKLSGSLPDGVGQTTIDKLVDRLGANLEDLRLITEDSRYSPETPVAKAKSNGMSVCFTGSLRSMGRTEASKKAEACGYAVKSSVGKGLTYLVTNDPYSGSSKNRKAQALGVKIINEDQFLKLVGQDDGQLDLL